MFGFNLLSLGIRLLFLGLISILAIGCVEIGESGSEGGTDVEVVPDPRTYVCDPFEEESAGEDPDHGLLGKLFYLDSSQPHYTQVSDYIDFGNSFDEIQLYFNQLFIPTRPFDRGFETHAGEVLQTPEGDTLYEWFALRYEGRLQLAPGQAAGYYQLALLSDDGSILRLHDGTDFVEHVNNDGTHPTRMGCTADYIYLDENSAIPMQLDYYQGPRFHISLIVLMRPFPGDPPIDMDPQCGKQGNSMYFDSTQDPPTPQPAYDALLARGWEPLGIDNYLVPEDEENPCNTPAPVVIEYFISAISSNAVTFYWSTDIPSSSQIVVTDATTGVEIVSPLDINLVTEHMVTLGGLNSNTLYRVKAISASSSGMSVETPESTFRTRR